MKTISIISQKGGSGKSTVALHLAVASSAERATGVIDLDPQASAASWADRRGDDPPEVVSAHASRLPTVMKEAEAQGFDLLILDTAPHSDRAALDAAKASDLVLVPSRTTILDIEPCLRTCELIATTKTPVCVVLNGIAPQGVEADEAARVIQDQGYPVASVRLGQRIAFSRALMIGRTAQEFQPSGKAAKEAAALHAFACTHLYTSTKKEARHAQTA